jgi:hypothetical protein
MYREQAQGRPEAWEAMTKNLNELRASADVKIIFPYATTKQSLIGETTKTVEANLIRGMLPGDVDSRFCSSSVFARR